MLLPPRRQASLPFHWSRHLPWLPGKWDRTKSWAAATRPTVCPHLSRLRTFRLSFYDPWVCFSFPPGMHPLHPTLSFVLTTPRCILLPGSSGRKGAQGLLAGTTAPSLSQVNTSFAAWKTTKWQDINVEQMDIDCKKFAKDVRSLDKEMKSWDAFVGLDNTVKNMITALRAVSELQNPAIRDRHWQQLMQATQVPCATGRWGVLAAG